jgi:hypothetical protein
MAFEVFKNRNARYSINMCHGNGDMSCPREPSTRHLLGFSRLQKPERVSSTGTVNDGGGSNSFSMARTAIEKHRCLPFSSHRSTVSRRPGQFCPLHRPTRLQCQTEASSWEECFESTSHKVRVCQNAFKLISPSQSTEPLFQ